MNFCKNCANYCEDFGTCRAARAHRDLVSGRTFTSNKPVHEMRYSEAYCGSTGRWFEKKEEGK